MLLKISIKKKDDNALLSKSENIQNLKGKTIIYMWFNQVRGDVNLMWCSWDSSNRFKSYLATSGLTSIKNSLIYSNLLKLP